MIKTPGMNKTFAAANDAGASAATTETFENAPTAATEDIAAVLQFDPFKGGEEIPEAKAQTQEKTDEAKPSGASDEKTTPAAAAQPAPETKPAASATPAAEDQAKHWQAVAEHYKTIVEGKTTKETPKEKEEEGIKVPEYDFNIPDGLIEALTTDDVGKFKVGVTALCKGIASAIHQQMATHMETTFNPRFAQMPVIVSQMLQAEAKNKAIADDFYGKNPELNQPQLRELVKQTAVNVAKSLNKTEWDAELRDETSKQVKAILAAAVGTLPAAPAQPARMLPSQGARPAVRNDDAEARDIADTLGFNSF